MRAIPLSLQAAYQDLVEGRRAHELAEIGGTPTLRQIADRGSYWYARQRIGDRVVDRYIGRDTEDLRAQLDRMVANANDNKALDRRCAAWVAQLRAAGLPPLDRESGKVLAAMARVGVFRLGGTLVGTHAYRLMSAELGVLLDAGAAVTEDLDIAAFENLKLVIDDAVDPTLAETFGALKLEPAAGLDPKHRSTSWRMQGGGVKIDFLTPLMQNKDEVRYLAPLGVHAQALAFLNFLIAEPIPAVGLYRSGVLVQIPRPERYAIHKLIVAQRRPVRNAAKATKDLAQASALIAVLAEDRPHALAEAHEVARAGGAAWRKALDQSLKQKPDLAERLAAL